MPLSPTTFANLVTFTRASTGTYFDATGTLQSAGNNVARFDYDPSTLAPRGFLIEEQRANIATYSADFGNAVWNKVRSTVSTDVTTSPAGTVTGDKLVSDLTAANNHILRLDIAVTNATTYTMSLFAKAAELTQVGLQFGTDNGAFAATEAYFTLSGAGTATTSAGSPAATIQNVGGGWYRCTVTSTATATATASLRILLFVSGSAVFNGDGTSGLFIWGAQLEAGALPTSYIPTTTTALTRSADVAAVNTLSPWFNSTAGTLYAEYAVSGFAPASAFPASAVLSDNTSSNRININSTNAGASLYGYAEVNTGGALQAGFYGASGSTFGAGTTRKSAIAYAANDFAFTTQGLVVQTDTSGTVPTVDRLYLGLGPTGAAQWQNGYLRRITYYPRKLSSAELQAITS